MTPTRLKPDIAIIGAAAYITLGKYQENRLFIASIEDIEKALQPKREVNILEKLPKEYYIYVDAFSR